LRVDDASATAQRDLNLHRQRAADHMAGLSVGAYVVGRVTASGGVSPSGRDRRPAATLPVHVRRVPTLAATKIRAEPTSLVSDSDECGAAASATTDTTTSSLSYGPHAPTAGGSCVPRTRRRVLRPKVFSSPAAAAVAAAPPAGELARRRTGPTSADRRSLPTPCGCVQLRLSDLSLRAASRAPRTLP